MHQAFDQNLTAMKLPKSWLDQQNLIYINKIEGGAYTWSLAMGESTQSWSTEAIIEATKSIKTPALTVVKFPHVALMHVSQLLHIHVCFKQ